MVIEGFIFKLFVVVCYLWVSMVENVWFLWIGDIIFVDDILCFILRILEVFWKVIVIEIGKLVRLEWLLVEIEVFIWEGFGIDNIVFDFFILIWWSVLDFIGFKVFIFVIFLFFDRFFYEFFVIVNCW